MRLCLVGSSTLTSLLLLAAAGTVSSEDTTPILDNRDSCAHRVVNCDPNVDHFATKISMDHASSVTRLEYANTHVLLEQSWPTRGPWMTATHQKVVLVRCGCPVPALSAEWVGSTILHVPVSSVMVQMPNTLTKLYHMGQRSKVVAIESTRFLSDGAPEVLTDVADGVLQPLTVALNGQPSTLLTIRFGGGVGHLVGTGFTLQLVDADCTPSDTAFCVLQETACIYPADDTKAPVDALEQALGVFASVPEWVQGGTLWILSNGEASARPTSLSYELFFDSQLPQSVVLLGRTGTCGGDDMLQVFVERKAASNRDPIYHRLNDLPGGFPDVLITEPRSLGDHATDPKIAARQFLDADPGEETPLGRAELMKLMALLVGSESTGNSLFDLIETRYLRAKELAATAQYRPSVMLGKPGTWNEAARNSWMITVGSTYIGQFLRDANVNYRNSDNSIQDAVCGSGCGVCPSGTSDTRCSVPIQQYLELFEWADYWIAAGIGANCWSASCNFKLTGADELLFHPNRDIFSQFLALRCGSVLALDQAHGVQGNTYWDLGRIRPDLILEDLVQLMHPDVSIEGDTTTFFRLLPPATNLTGVPACPRTVLPNPPSAGTVHITAHYLLEANPPSSAESQEVDFIGAPEFVVLDKLYTAVQPAVAKELGVEAQHVQLRMLNHQQDEGVVPLAVTVRVTNCPNHQCAVPVGEKLTSLGSVMAQALNLAWVPETTPDAASIVVLDRQEDRIPLADLLSSDPDQGDDKDDDDGVNTVGLAVGIVVTVLAFAVSIFVTYKMAYAKGIQNSQPCLQDVKQVGAASEEISQDVKQDVVSADDLS